jgi:hypothetical protein
MPPRIPVLPIVAAAALAAAVVFVGKRKREPRSIGSQSIAHDVVDAPAIAPGATPEELLDAAVQYSFPASDPISIEAGEPTN